METNDVPDGSGSMTNRKIRFPDLHELEKKAPSSRQSDNRVLILDDDQHFRGILAALLSAHGYDVQHAATAEEASACIAESLPGAAIVDYDLPDQDGASWIAKIRNDGAEFPIVFVSGLWCDEPTFKRLRDDLLISMIIQKPLVPELFMHSVETVLPERTKYRSPSDSSDSEFETDRITLEEIPQDLKAEISSVLEQERAAYVDQLPSIWQDLTDSFDLFSLTPQVSSLEVVVRKAHRIAGTSGTCGLGAIAGIAENIESFLSPHLAGSELNPGQLPWLAVSSLLEEGRRIAVDLTSSAVVGLFNQTAKAGVRHDVFGHAPVVSTQSDSPKILCVDDDPQLLSFLENLLGTKGYDIRSLDAPNRILDALEIFCPDLILMDAVMPIISGYELCRLLKGSDRWKHIPVIFMTRPSPSRRAAAARAGASAFAEKPLLPEVLLTLVSAQLKAAAHSS